MPLYIPTSPQYEREMLVPVDQGVMCTVRYGTGSGEPALGCRSRKPQSSESSEQGQVTCIQLRLGVGWGVGVDMRQLPFRPHPWHRDSFPLGLGFHIQDFDGTSCPLPHPDTPPHLHCPPLQG